MLLLEAEIPVQTVAIDDLAEIQDFDAIKLDVQGAELDVLKGAQKKLSAATLVLSEVEFIPLYENQPLFGDVDGFLRAHGFLLHHLDYPAMRMMWPAVADPGITNAGSNSLWSEAVFTRDFRQLDVLSADKLWKLALLMHDGLRYFDFTARVLWEIDRKTSGNALKRYKGRLSGTASTV